MKPLKPGQRVAIYGQSQTGKFIGDDVYKRRTGKVIDGQPCEGGEWYNVSLDAGSRDGIGVGIFTFHHRQLVPLRTKKRPVIYVYRHDIERRVKTTAITADAVACTPAEDYLEFKATGRTAMQVTDMQAKEGAAR